MASLFLPERLALLANASAPPREAMTRKMGQLDRLVERVRAGQLKVKGMTESKIEQSFNERIFAELFDYQSLFAVQGRFTMVPKWYYGKAEGGTPRYDDLSLGHFGESGFEPKISMELKSPGTNLDKPQSSYQGLPTPVQQAHGAVRHTPSVKWIIVSNFDEIRLRHTSSTDDCEKAVMSDVFGEVDFRRLYALFSSRTLLGNRGQLSPLDILREEKEGTSSMVPEKIEGRIRLVQQARLEEAVLRPPGFHEIDNLIRLAGRALNTEYQDWDLPATNLLTRPRLRPRNEEKLAISGLMDDNGQLLVEMTQNGEIRMSNHLPKYPNGLSAVDLVASILLFHFLMCSFYNAFKPEGGKKVELYWRLEDVENTCLHEPGAASYRSSSSVAIARLPDQSSDRYRDPSQTVDWALGELLFYFEDPNENRISWQKDLRTRVLRELAEKYPSANKWYQAYAGDRTS